MKSVHVLRLQVDLSERERYTRAELMTHDRGRKHRVPNTTAHCRQQRHSCPASPWTIAKLMWLGERESVRWPLISSAVWAYRGHGHDGHDGYLSLPPPPSFPPSLLAAGSRFQPWRGEDGWRSRRNHHFQQFQSRVEYPGPTWRGRPLMRTLSSRP